jgi:phosphonoacetate hydrolase
MKDGTMRGQGMGPVRLVFMIDGLGMDYFESGAMPYLASLFAEGDGQIVEALWPTVTNVNNAAIACGAPPSSTGITGNSMYDPETGEERYMDSSSMLKQPTLLESWTQAGRSCGLITSKGKTVRLLGRGLALTISGQECADNIANEVGAPPHIYSPDINYWLLDCLRWALSTRGDLDTFYLHTTDYPMHMWEPGDERSKAHLSQLDAGIRQIAESLADVEILLTADHAMNGKSRAIDLGKVLERSGVTGAKALSIEKDGLVAHHKDYGGGAWVYVEEDQMDRAKEVLAEVDGVEEVLNRKETAERFLLDADRIGDLAVFADRQSAFGVLAPDEEIEVLAPTYRSHGSLYEREVPLLRWGSAFNDDHSPAPMNWQLLASIDGASGSVASGALDRDRA